VTEEWRLFLAAVAAVSALLAHGGDGVAAAVHVRAEHFRTPTEFRKYLGGALAEYGEVMNPLLRDILEREPLE
jgi:hypothetical protein